MLNVVVAGHDLQELSQISVSTCGKQLAQAQKKGAACATPSMGLNPKGISPLGCSRQTPSNACDRVRGELPVRDGRLPKPCASGTRACSRACASKVEMCVSSCRVFGRPTAMTVIRVANIVRIFNLQAVYL